MLLGEYCFGWHCIKAAKAHNLWCTYVGLRYPHRMAPLPQMRSRATVCEPLLMPNVTHTVNRGYFERWGYFERHSSSGAWRPAGTGFCLPVERSFLNWEAKSRPCRPSCAAAGRAFKVAPPFKVAPVYGISLLVDCTNSYPLGLSPAPDLVLIFFGWPFGQLFRTFTEKFDSRSPQVRWSLTRSDHVSRDPT